MKKTLTPNKSSLHTLKPLNDLYTQQKAHHNKQAFGARVPSTKPPLYSLTDDDVFLDDLEDHSEQDREIRDQHIARNTHVNNTSMHSPWRGHAHFEEWIDDMDSDGGFDFPWDETPSVSDFPETHFAHKSS